MTDPNTVEHVDQRVVLSDGSTFPNLEPAAGVPTQVANPRRASWRTFFQALLAFLIVVNAAAGVVALFLADPSNGIRDLIDPSIYGAIVAVVNGLVVIGSGVAKLVALLMANPIVNAWITAYLPWLAPIKPLS